MKKYKIKVIAAVLFGALSVSAAAALPICASGPRINCVVDGDTVWLDGEKIRLEGIDAPEARGRCHRELIAAANATERLRQLLTHNRAIIQRSGKDRYGRTLAKLRIGNSTAGQIMINEGLVRPWRGKRENWC